MGHIFETHLESGFREHVERLDFHTVNNTHQERIRVRRNTLNLQPNPRKQRLPLLLRPLLPTADRHHADVRERDEPRSPRLWNPRLVDENVAIFNHSVDRIL